MWKSIGKALAMVGKGALTAAMWASEHPEVLQLVASAVPNPAAKAAINEAIEVTEVVTAIKK